MTNAEQNAVKLTERWWEHTQQYIDSAHWGKASATLSEADPRVLLLGPGPRSDLYMVTQALEQFLNQAGFRVHRMDEDLAPESHRSKAREYERIAAVPVTVGSTVEIFDLLVEDHRNGGDYGLRHRIKILLPQNYATGYFARVLQEDFEVKVRFCDPFGPGVDEVPAEIGGLLLKRLAEGLNSSRGQSRSLALTERVPEPSNLQAREVAKDPPDLDLPPPITVQGDVNINSPHSSGEDSSVVGRDAASSEGTVASGQAQIAQAEGGSQAATGDGRSSGGAPQKDAGDKNKGSRRLAVVFALILIASLVALLAGVEAAIAGIGIGAVGAGVAVYRLYKGT